MMEQKMKERLREDEQLLWIGKPGSRKIMDSPDKTKVIIAWSVLALFLVVSFGYLVPFLVKGGDSLGKILVMLVFVNVTPMLIATRPLLDKRRLDKETIYAVTDKRILALVGSDLFELPRTEGLACKVVDGNLCFGTAGDIAPKKARDHAVVGCKDDDRRLGGILFYQLPNTNQVLEAIV